MATKEPTTTETTKRKKTAAEKTTEAVGVLRSASILQMKEGNRDKAIFLDDKAKEIEAEMSK